MLMTQARGLRQPMPAATHETLIGLLAASGLFSGAQSPCAGVVL